MKNSILWFCRIFVGVLFIFSGLVKANDPVGFGIKLDEYYEVFASTWSWTGFLFKSSLLLSTTTIQAAFLTILEIVLGIALILGIAKNLVAWLLLLLILFFTWLTGFTAITGNPATCGCFGDAIPLTAQQSFYKDIVLTILIVIIFFMRKNIKPLFSPALNAIVFLLVAGFAVWVNIHVIRHDVFIDFRPYAVGKNIQEQMFAPADAPKSIVRMTYVYENKNSGEKEKVTLMSDSADYSALKKYSDTTEWKFKERVDKILDPGFVAETADFSVSDVNGRNLTSRILNNPDYQLMVVCSDFDHTNGDGWERINEVQKDAEKEGVFTFALVGEGAKEIEKFRHEFQTAFPFYPGDSKVSLTIARVDPAVVLLKKGTVIDKWGWRDLPSYAEIKSTWFPDRKPTELIEMSDDMFAVNENISTPIKNGDEPYSSFYLEDTTGNDAAPEIFSDSGTIYMLIVNETSSDKLSKDKWSPVNRIMHALDSAHVNYFVVSSVSGEIQKQMRNYAGLNYNYYGSDKDVLHNIVEQNAGLVVIKDGVVIKKYTEAKWPADNSFLIN